MAEAVKPKTKKKNKHKPKLRVPDEPSSFHDISEAVETLPDLPSVSNVEPQPASSADPHLDEPKPEDEVEDPGGKSSSTEHDCLLESKENSTILDINDSGILKEHEADESKLTEDGTVERLEETEPADTELDREEFFDSHEYQVELAQTSLPLGVQKKWITEARVIDEGLEITACPSDRRPDFTADEHDEQEDISTPCAASKSQESVSNGNKDPSETDSEKTPDLATVTEPEAAEKPAHISREEPEEVNSEEHDQTDADIPGEVSTKNEPHQENAHEVNVEDTGQVIMREPVAVTMDEPVQVSVEEPTMENIEEPDQTDIKPRVEDHSDIQQPELVCIPHPPDVEESISDVVHRRLYPELDIPQDDLEDERRRTTMEPFSEEQLKSLYHNQELENQEEYVENFLLEAEKAKNEFYEIVLNYYRARNKLASAEHDIQVLQRDYLKYKDLVWELSEEKITAQGQCADKSKVTAEVMYSTSRYDESSCDDVSRTLRSIRCHLHEQLSLYGYEAQLSRLQVESYLYQLYAQNSSLCDSPPNSPVQAFLPHEMDNSTTQQVSALKNCLTVLFMFQRKPSKDDVFVKDCRQWIEILVATLLRLASMEDHLYLINQVLRCPAGVSRWGARFIQAVPPPYLRGVTPRWGSPLLDHFVTMLAFVLLPVKKREEWLYQMNVVQAPAVDQAADNPWIIVDSDGEEDEESLNTGHYLQENDLMTVLNQLPLAYAFTHVLLIDIDSNDQNVYDAQKTNENGLLRLFAFSTRLIHLLASGLDHFSLSRYRQLNKWLAKMIKTIIQLLSCHWECFQEAFPRLPLETMDRLQLEYNMVFRRAVTAILSAQRLGSWQFLAQLPYKCVSMDTMWQLLWIMHKTCYYDNTAKPEPEEQSPEEQQTAVPSAEECQQLLQDAGVSEEFQQKLMSMPTSEAIYLLTTFANMAQGRPSSDTHFIQTVAKEIYEIAYIQSHTRELCSKQGRDLLTSITSIHPFVLSDLLHITKATMDNIGVEKQTVIGSYIWTPEKTFSQVALYLYKDLPLHGWHPTRVDRAILKDWLMTRAISSLENQLARLIVQKMNWGFNEKATDLFLEPSLHHEMALLLVDIYSQHLTGTNIGNLVTEGIKQVASLIRYQETEEQLLANWAWEVAQKLCLHEGQLPGAALMSYTHPSLWPERPDLYQDVSLQLVAAAVGKQFALASYLGLMMSKYSHSVADFCSEGIKLLGSLAVKCHHIPTIRVLYHITPIFYNHEQYLLSNDMFIQVLKLLMQADSLKRGMFFNVFPGPITKLFAGAIQCQIQQASAPGGVGAVTVVLFWIKLLVKLDYWTSDKDILYVVDKMLESVFPLPQAWAAVQEHFAGLYKTLVTKDTDPTLLTSLSSFFGSSKPLPSLIENQYLAEFPWMVFLVLQVEGAYEEEASRLWPSLQDWLHEHPSSTVEAALQAVCQKMKFCMSRSSGRLCVYRWVHQAVNMEVSHPLLPLVWQRFFVLYLGRATTQPGLPQRGSVGEKFFHSGANVSLMKKMKKRLADTVTYFQDLARGIQGIQEQTSEDGPDSLSSVCDVPLVEDRHWYLAMVKFYQTLLFWLDEPRLHDPGLYLPALPTQYNSDRLLQVFQNCKDPWLKEVNFKAINDELIAVSNEWSRLVTQDEFCMSRASKESATMTAPQLILHLLKPDVEPLSPPPLAVPRAPIPELNTSLLGDQQNLLFALRGDFNILADFSKVYSNRVAKNVGLDCSFVELLPSLYKNETTESAASAVCKSTFNPTHRCKGAAIITCRYDAAKRNDIVYRKLEENRAEYSQLLIESLLPPPQNVCSAAVHVEFAISSLIKLLKEDPSQKVLDVGTALFYNVSTFVSEDTKYYPPTCQFFSSCIEILGQEFIRNNPAQSQPLLQAILQTPSLVGLLAPNFSPTACPDLFVTMYQDMVPVPRNQGPDIAVALLTKFELDQWLNGKPSLSQREALLEVIGQALCQCGKQQESCMESVFQVYRIHLRTLSSFQFPDHYGSVLKLILKGSGAEQTSSYIWDDFLQLLGCELPAREGSQAARGTLASELSAENISDTLDWMSSHFLGLRISNSDYTSFGLYPKWKDYIPYLSRLLCFLINKNIHEMASRASAQACDPELTINNLWQKITDIFAPWIQPLESNDQILTPWIQTDMESADVMIVAWVSTIQNLQDQFESLLPVFSKQALGLLWRYYVHKLAKKEIPKHVVALYHSRLISLPWEKFYPDIHGVEMMMRICTSFGYHHSCREFLGHLFSRFPWTQVTGYYTQCEIPEIRMRLHVCFFSLLVRLSQEKDVLLTTHLPELLEQAEGFDWNTIDGTSYQETSAWFQENCDPKCVLAERGAGQALILRLLKVASGFIMVPNAAFHPETPVKRCAYVRCIVQLLCKCSHLKEVHMDNFKLIITNLLTEVEGVVGTIADPMAQEQESMALCLEVLGVLNHSNPQGASLKVLAQALLEWVGMSATSPLLLPMLSAACRGLAALTDMVRVVEACMDSYFTADVTGSEGAGWGRLLTVLQVPELAQDRFITEALMQGCYLILYGYMLQQLPLSQSIDDEMDCLKRLVFWTTKAKPGPQSESKMLLWWDKILELLPRQLSLGGKEVKVVEQLKKLVPFLVSHGEDKDHSGLLGAIGLGKKSQLSLRFRVLANSLATYLSVQVPSDGSLRKAPDDPGHISESLGSRSPTRTSPGHVGPSQHALQSFNHMESMKANKKYATFKEQLEFASSFMTNRVHSVVDTPKLFISLLVSLYPDVNYLAVIRLKPGA